MVCKVSVLLPIPGSPPNRTMEPGTSPPPSTRLSSASCISMRGSSLAEISCRNSGRFFFCASMAERTDIAADFAACEPVSLEPRIALNVFHCPQLGHLPIHLDDSCPQLSQT